MRTCSYSRTTDWIIENTFVTASGCWEWILGRDARGYGVTTLNGNHIRAHRLSWILHNGSISDGLHVLHKCDNPPCANPDHLFLGTPMDNAMDRHSKGRFGLMGIASRIHKAKLTFEAAEAIRREYKPNVVTRKALSLKYGIAKRNIDKILSGESWAKAEFLPLK